jgi:hypothetical protein
MRKKALMHFLKSESHSGELDIIGLGDYTIPELPILHPHECNPRSCSHIHRPTCQKLQKEIF